MNLSAKILKTIENLEARNIQASYMEDEFTVIEKVFELISTTISYTNQLSNALCLHIN